MQCALTRPAEADRSDLLEVRPPAAEHRRL